MEPLVLTFDIGTQSLRGVLMDSKGNILDMVQRKFDKPYFSVEPGRAEQHGEFYWENLCSASKALKEKDPEKWKLVKGVTITTIRDSILCLDKEGNPLRPVILWLDKRETPDQPPLSPKADILFKAAGMSSSAELIKKTSPCNWIRNNEKDIWEKTHKLVMLSAYMNFKFCGKIVDSKANIIGHLPFDNKKGEWLSENSLKYELFPVEKDKLCPLVNPGDIFGEITEKASAETGIETGLPLIATGSDKGCETIGLSCTSPEKAAISFGTTATVQFTSEKYVEPQKYFPAYISPHNGSYNSEIEIYRGYWLISWFKKEFAAKEVKEAELLGVAPEELLNKRLSEIPPGCDGLVFQPYFTPGVSMPNARGSVIGFSDIHTRIHIYRAIIEGINFALMEGMRSMEKRLKTKTEGIYVGGGGSRSSEICQITADMFGVPVYRSQTHETAVIGSSMVAFTTLGVFKDLDEAIEAMVHIKDTFKPNMENHEIYETMYREIFTKIFKRLNPLYTKTNIMK